MARSAGWRSVWISSYSCASRGPIATAAPVCSTAPRWIGSSTARGPSAWSTLSPEFASCGIGREQSPIDIVAAGGKAWANLASVADPAGATTIIEDAAVVLANHLRDAGSDDDHVYRTITTLFGRPAHKGPARASS